MRTLLFLIVLLSSVVIQAQQYSKVKIYLNPIAENLLQQKGLELDHGIVKKGVFIINDFDSETISWMNQSGIEYDVLIDDVKEYYVQRSLDEVSRGNRGACFNGQIDTFDIPENFELGSMGGFYTYEEFLQNLDSMHALFPDLISERSVIDTFLTHQGSPLYQVKISDNVSLNEDEPELLYTAVHHSREPQSLTQLIFYMWYLLENYSSDNEVKHLIDNTQMYFVPMINPDGYIYNETTDPNGGGMWRKNRRNNGDGTNGVDLNRNYGYGWGGDNQGSSPNTSSETYRGIGPFSEPETKAVAWLCEQHEFALALNYHSFGNYLIYPWGTGVELTPDSNTFIALASEMTRQNNYVYGTGLQTVGYNVNGDSDDWMYGEQLEKNKILSMTPEVGAQDDGFWPAASRIVPLSQENVMPNLLLAHFTGDYAKVESNASQFVNATTGNFEFRATRLGLQFNGPYTFSVDPVSSNIESVGASVDLASMVIAEEYPISISYALDASIEEGDEVVYDVVAEFNGFSTKQRVTRIFGLATPLIQNDGDISEFVSGTNWGETTEDFVSPSTSITDSPFGMSQNNTLNDIELSAEIDLENSTLAQLQFQAKWFIEAGWDYAQILASPAGEENWSPLCGKYSVEGNSFQDFGQPVWDGFQGNWVQEEVSLNDYLGQRIRIKFRMVTDPFVTFDGFYFDDLEVVAFQNEIEPDGVKEELRPQWSVFPNPAVNVIHIEAPRSANLTYTVFDLSGRMVAHGMVNDGNVDVSSWNQGSYVLKLTNEKRTETHRIVLVK
jgi:carboxypeptidase T